MSDDTEVRSQLHLLVKSEDTNTNDQPIRQQIMAAAGSPSQLPHVKMELKQESAASSTSHDTGMTYGSVQLPKIKTKSLVGDIPFSVKLLRLSEATIRRYTKRLAPKDI